MFTARLPASLSTLRRIIDRANNPAHQRNLDKVRQTLGVVGEADQPPNVLVQLIPRILFRETTYNEAALLGPELERVGLPATEVKRYVWDERCGVAGVWKPLEKGAFFQGKNANGRRVEIADPFWVAVYPFTNGQAMHIESPISPANGKALCFESPHSTGEITWSNLVENKGPYYFRCPHFGVGEDLRRPIPGSLRLPLVGVDETVAKRFLELDGAALPTANQWEYAARYEGPQTPKGERLGFSFPTGDGYRDARWQLLAHIYHYNNQGQPSVNGTIAVGSYPREKGSGLYDMGGNVMELIKFEGANDVLRPASRAMGGFWCRGFDEKGEMPREAVEILTIGHKHEGGVNNYASYVGFRAVLNSPPV